MTATALEIVTHSEDETEQLATNLARALLAANTARVILLDGDLGAGKTTFVRGFVRALPGGGDVTVQSPTFALARTYETTPPVRHLDLYRLDDGGALEALGLDDLIDLRAPTDGFALVEWARALVVPDVARAPVRVRFTTVPGDVDARAVRLTLPPDLAHAAPMLTRTA